MWGLWMASKFVAVVARNDSTAGGTLLRKVPTHSRSGDVYLECRTVCYDGEVISILPHAGGSAHAAEAADFAWVRTAMGVEGYMKCAYLRCVVVIGITGCTRCGKGRVSRALSQRLGDTVIVGQDDYWIGAVAVTTPDGNSVPNLSLLPISRRDSARGCLPITVVAPATNTNALCQDENVNEQQECGHFDCTVIRQCTNMTPSL